jgi:citrate lyase subunit beta/citryl-CoA lyase
MSGREISASTAGPLGEKVRSDVHVAYDPGADPLSIDVESKVAYLYGKAIEKAARRVCAAFHVDTGRLTLTDAGALEWVILARVETCLNRAGYLGDPVLPNAADSVQTSRQRNRMRRSRLYVPGNQPKLMLSAGLYKADGIILDLEDSVPPAEKDAARVLVRNALVALDWGSSERMVRVNQGSTGTRDLEVIAPFNPHTVLLPKVEHAVRVRRAAEVLRERLGEECPFLMPILESPIALHRAFDIADSDVLVVALTLGLEDLSAELGAPRSEEGTESLLARQTVVYAARAAGVQPIASVYSDINNEEGLAAYVRRERGLGFDGIGCIHPRQIPIVHREMTPTPSEIDRAVKIVRAATEAEKLGLGAVAVGSKMVDPPVVKQANRTVELAIAGGCLDADWQSEGGDGS